MATESSTSATGQKPRRRGLKIAGIIVGVLLLLIVAAYFVGTSAGFLKGVILPRVSDSMNAEVTVSDASISPFSRVALRDLKVVPRGEKEPLLTAAEVRASYSLMQILRGNILVEDVTVAKPVIQVVEKPDGTSNLDPILKAQEQKPKEPEKASAEPAKIDIRRIQVTDGTVRQIKVYNAAHQDQVEMSNLSVTVSNLKNGQTGKLQLGADIRMQAAPPPPETNGTLQAVLNGTFDLGLGGDLKPTLVQGNSRLTVREATGGFAGVGKSAGELDVDMTATEIRNVALRLVRDNQPLAQVRAKGPFDLNKLEGAIAVTLEEMDRRSLNVLGAAAGLDFGTTAISSTNLVQVSEGADRIGLRGRFAANRFQVVRTNEATPALDLSAQYDVEVKLSTESALLRSLDLSGLQNNQAFLLGHLTSPMSFGWSTNAQAVGDSDLSIVVTNFNLANWKALLAETAPAGVVNAVLQLRSTAGGNQLAYQLSSRVEDLALVVGSNRVDQAGVTASLKGTAVNATNIALTDLSMELTHRGRTALRVKGNGALNTESEQAGFALSGSAGLPVLLSFAAQPNTAFQSGEASFAVNLAKTQEVSTVTGAATLTNFTGQVGSNRFNAYWLAAGFDIRMAGDQLEIRRTQGSLGEGANGGGQFNVAGKLAVSNVVGQITGGFQGLNQYGMRPFVESALGDLKLQSILLNGDFKADLNTVSNVTVAAQMSMTNLVVKDPAGKFPATPLGMGAKLQAAISNNVAQLSNTELQLTPTERARNLVTLAARIDYSRTNAIRGDVELKSEALDLTRYYELYEATSAGTSGTAPTTTGTPTPAPAPGPEQEPEPMDLGLTNFVARAAIGQFYLRELQVTNLESVIRVDGGKVQISPARMSINGAPVEFAAAADVSVPGYRYETRFSALQVPFAPLVNTFVPERQGQLGGTLTATGHVAGAGITGPNLKKHLKADFNIGTTNLNLAIADTKSKLLRTVVNVIAIIPDLRKNPNAALGSLTGALFGGTSARASGYMDELAKSPIDIIELRGNVDAGRMALERAFVQSRAFQAKAEGNVGLADVLTNSTIHIPLHVTLERSIAQRIDFVPAGTPTNAAYVAVPDYVTLKGTVGEPKTEINKMALLGTALEQLGGKIPGVDQKTGSLIQGLGGILSGRRATPAETNAPAPSAATNTPSVSTNAPAATNAPSAAPTNQNPVGNLLNQLLNPGRK